MRYFGPETTMPLASAIAAGVGVVLMFWRRMLNGFRALFARLFRRSGGPGADTPTKGTR